MSILWDEEWIDLYTWIEQRPANGAISIKYEPYRIDSLYIYLHDISKPAASAPTGSESIPLTGNQPSNRLEQTAVYPELRRLSFSELAVLQQDLDPDRSLFPKPRAVVGDWLPQPIDDIRRNLETSIGYVRGCAPVSDIIATTERPGYFKRNKFDFNFPVNLVLGHELRGDCIMRGLQSPALDSQITPVQNWRARSYIFMRRSCDMGAVIQSRHDMFAHNSIDVCEMQALIILLDRQTAFKPNKRKLRAWLISINRRRGFRILEAWLDQDAKKHAIHFSILEEREWPGSNKEGWHNKLIDGITDELKWLLSWAMAQRT